MLLSATLLFFIVLIPIEQVFTVDSIANKQPITDNKLMRHISSIHKHFILNSNPFLDFTYKEILSKAIAFLSVEDLFVNY